MSPIDIVSIAPREDHISAVVFTSKPNCKPLAFPKDYSSGISPFNEERENPIIPLKYVYARLKCCDNRFVANPQYIFHTLNWIKCFQFFLDYCLYESAG